MSVYTSYSVEQFKLQNFHVIPMEKLFYFYRFNGLTFLRFNMSTDQDITIEKQFYGLCELKSPTISMWFQWKSQHWSRYYLGKTILRSIRIKVSDDFHVIPMGKPMFSYLFNGLNILFFSELTWALSKKLQWNKN